MNHLCPSCRRFLLWGAACAMMAAGGPSPAQERVPWVEPPERLVFDFGSDKLEARTVLAEDGAAYEATVTFALVGRRSVTVVIRLPEPGRAELDLTNPSALIDRREIRRQPQELEYQIAAKTPPSRNELGAQARRQAREALAPHEDAARREAKSRKKEDLRFYLSRQGVQNLPEEDDRLHDLYAQHRAIELGASTLRQKLAEFAERRPGWFRPPDRQAWAAAEGRQLWDAYWKLLELEMGEEYLGRLGFELDTTTRAGMIQLDSKLEGVSMLLSGATLGSGPDARRALRGLSAEDGARLRRAATVALRCRYYFPTDPADHNSQWFHAQRVACQARSASSIVVEGRLDPAQGDAADWWLLEGYDPGRIAAAFPQDERLHHELFTTGGQTRLRIAAQGKEAVSYRLEFRPRAAATAPRELVTHEYASPREAKFPF